MMLTNMIILGIWIKLESAPFLTCYRSFLSIGAHVWGNLLPRRQAYQFAQFSQRYGAILLFTLLILPHVSTFSPLQVLIGVPRRWLTHLLLQGL